MSVIVSTVVVCGGAGVCGALALVARTHREQSRYVRDLDARREPTTRLGQAIWDRHRAEALELEPGGLDDARGTGAGGGPAGGRERPVGEPGGHAPWPCVADGSVLGRDDPGVMGGRPHG